MPHRQTAHRLAGNAIWNLLPFGLGFLLNMLAVRLVIDRIGLSDFGLFGLMAAVLAPLTLANLGFGEATIKYVAAAAAGGDLDGAARYVRTTLAMNLIVGIAGATLLATAGPGLVVRLFDLPAESHPRVAAVLSWVGIGWVGNQVGAVFLGVPAAFQRFRLAALGQTISQVGLAGLGVAGAYRFGLTGYAAGTAAGAWLGALAWWFIGRGLLPGRVLTPRVEREAWRRSFAFGGWQALAQVGALLANQGERFLLGAYLTPSAVGLYNVAQGFEQRFYSIVYKLSEVLFPHFSATEGAAAERKADQLLRASWLLTGLAVCALAPLIPLATPILTAWLSSEVAAQAAPVMRTLALAGILGCASNASLFFLLGNGATKGIAILTGVTGLIAILAAWVILPRYGLAAAGAGQVIAMVAQQGILALLLLPGLLESAWSRSRATVIIYAPVVVGVAMAMMFDLLGFSTLQGWLRIGAAYLVIAGVAGLGVLLAGAATPGRAQRAADLRVLAAPALRLLRGGA